MTARFGFHVGPFYFSQRLGRTQAQKRAAARARTQRATERQRRQEKSLAAARSEYTALGTITEVEPDGYVTIRLDEAVAVTESGPQHDIRVRPSPAIPGLAKGLRTGVTWREQDKQITGIWPVGWNVGR
jgi:hypothetical protein